MQISYGPPGARGVTQLMAVGGDDDPADNRETRGVLVGALLAVGAGFLMGSKTIKQIGIGAAIGAIAVEQLRKRPRAVVVTAPVATTGWY